MDTLLIKCNDKKSYSLLLEIAKLTKAKTKILTDDEELDLLLNSSINEGMKSGKASKEEVNKFFKKNGIRIHE
jgi:hypothetical protein